LDRQRIAANVVMLFLKSRKLGRRNDRVTNGAEEENRFSVEVLSSDSIS
jgi:hypothetical protein